MKNPIETLPKELIQHAHLFRVFKPPQSSQPNYRIQSVESQPKLNATKKRRYDSSTSFNSENVVKTPKNTPVSAKPITISNEGPNSNIYITIVKALRWILVWWGGGKRQNLKSE